MNEVCSISLRLKHEEKSGTTSMLGMGQEHSVATYLATKRFNVRNSLALLEAVQLNLLTGWDVFVQE